MKKTLKRLIGPALILGAVLLAALFQRDFLLEFSADAVTKTQQVLFYSLQIGIWLAAAFFVDRLVKVLIWDGVVERALGAPVPRLIKDVFTFVLFMIALAGIVGVVFEKSVTGLWATTGGVGIVVGFALRNMILDVFAGIAINIERPIRIGDWVWLHDRNFDQEAIGCVREINWRTTRFRTIENNMLIVPNSVLSAGSLTNFSMPSVESRFELTLPLDPSVPTERAMRVINAGVQAVVGEKGLIEERKSKVKINELNDVGVEYKVKYWIRPAEVSPSTARHKVYSSILHHLKAAGIGLAYPKQDIFHKEMPTRHLDALSDDGRTQLLQQIALFGALEDAELEQLSRSMAQRTFKGREDLIELGADGDSMFVLVEGLVHVYIDLKGEGELVKVGQILPGAFFGEMSLLTGELRSATIRAATDVVAYEITRDDLNDLVQRRPEIAEKLTRAVAENRLRDKLARSNMTDEEKEQETSSVAAQLMGKMKSFFKGVF
jgi:small-conductance mechanosensitive channel/CRP-like cAMP-binding protein